MAQRVYDKATGVRTAILEGSSSARANSTMVAFVDGSSGMSARQPDHPPRVLVGSAAGFGIYDYETGQAMVRDKDEVLATREDLIVSATQPSKINVRRYCHECVLDDIDAIRCDAIRCDLID